VSGYRVDAPIVRFVEGIREAHMRVEGKSRVEAKSDNGGAVRFAGIVSMLAGLMVLAFAVVGVSNAGATTSKPQGKSSNCDSGSYAVLVSAGQSTAHGGNCGSSSTTTTPCNTTTTGAYATTTTTTSVPGTPGIVTTTTIAATTTTAPATTTTAPATTTTAPATTTTETPTTVQATTTTGETIVTSGVSSTTIAPVTSTTTTQTVPVSVLGHPTTSITVKGTSVTSATAVGSGTLPFTGSSSFPLVIVALALIGSGLGLLLHRKRRVLS
jgi:LPXTG-motif cell wall-anchored protein